ncbi:unnamed protein product [Lota lota]
MKPSRTLAVCHVGRVDRAYCLAINRGTNTAVRGRDEQVVHWSQAPAIPAVDPVTVHHSERCDTICSLGGLPQRTVFLLRRLR